MSRFVTVAKADAVPENHAVIVEAEGRSIALCRIANDDIYAIDNVCTHDNGPLGEGVLRGDRIECPRHGALFDVRSGAAKTLPAIKPVRIYRTRVADGEIQVDLESAE